MLSQNLKHNITEIETNFTNGKSDLALNYVLENINQLELNSNQNTLLLSKHYNLAGEIYHHYSDIEEAHKYWEKSFRLIKNKFGNNSIYLAENYSLISRYFNFEISIDSAYYYSEKSIKLCRIKKDSLYLIPVNKIYREYAYALKIKKEKTNYLKARDESKIYLDSAMFFNHNYLSGNTIYDSQIYHDIGNLFTDKALYYKRELNNQSKSTEYLAKANNYYDKSLQIRKQKWGNKHDKISTLYFVKGLSYLYCYKYDSLYKVLSYYQKSLCALSTQFNNESIYSIPTAKCNFSNPASALTLLRFKIDAFYFLYLKTNDIKYLEHCYKHSLAAVELWQNTFTKLKTNEIHLALEVYGASPFSSIIPYANKYFQLAKKEEIKQNIFKWIELNKYSTILKNQIESKSILIKPSNSVVTEIQNKLKSNQAIVEYYVTPDGLICSVISKNTFEVFPINETFKSETQSDSLLLNLKKHNAKAYCKTAKILYDNILNPYIKLLPKEITHLIIIPHGKLTEIPFEALVLNKTNNYSKAEYLIKHYMISYALSCNLLFNNKTDLLTNSISIISPEYRKHSNLPFSKKIVNDLSSDFNTSSFSLTDTSSDNSILHISAHAYADYQNSRNSYILTSDNQKLPLSEISKTKLKYKLAILNACETANGTNEVGEGTINFSRHFYLAGVKSTITTLWKVDDEATATIIKYFYSEFQNGNNTIASLHNAKLTYLENTKSVDDYDPYYWAGSIYTGNDMVLERKNNWHYYLIGGSVIIAGLFLSRKFRF